MKLNYVNPDHVHAVVDPPTRLAVEELALKADSSI
jgi:hypothetical protein